MTVEDLLPRLDAVRRSSQGYVAIRTFSIESYLLHQGKEDQPCWPR